MLTEYKDIERRRKGLRLSITELCNRSGICFTTYDKRRKGVNKNFSLVTIVKIDNAFDGVVKELKEFL